MPKKGSEGISATTVVQPLHFLSLVREVEAGGRRFCLDMLLFSFGRKKEKLEKLAHSLMTFGANEGVKHIGSLSSFSSLT